MSEENMGAAAPQGKGLAIGGFVLALLGLVLSTWIAGITTVGMMESVAETGEIGGKGLMYFWVVLCLISIVLSVMGMMKLGKTGGKKGLGIAGMIIGIVATVWSVMLLLALDTAAAAAGMQMDAFDQAMDDIEMEIDFN